jgi:DNA polymerase III alpha subunit
LGKERWEMVEKFFTDFANGARRLGRSEADIEKVWKLVCSFSGYAFCKAHSTAYGVEAYQAAWLKRYFPAEFMAAVLTNGKGFYRPIVYILECHRLGLPLAPPSINDPGPAFNVREGRIRVPALRAKGLNQRTQERIVAARRDGEFASIADFYHRVQPATDELETLARVGAFDVFGRSRTRQFWEIQHLVRSTPAGQALLPTGLDDHRVPATELTEPTALEQLQFEQDLLDFPVTGHPLDLYPDIAWNTYCSVADLAHHIGETVTCCGLIIEDRLHQQTTGELMKFLTLADWTGIVETELFADTYRSYGLATVRYPVLEVTAKVEPFENRNGWSLRVLRAGKPREQSSVPRRSD